MKKMIDSLFNRRCIFSKIEGLTLVEVMVAIVLSTFLGMLVFTVFLYSNKSNVSNVENSIMQQNLIFAMDMIETDVKNAGCKPMGGTFNAFTDLSLATTLGVNADLRDCSGFTSPSSGQAEYFQCLANTTYNRTDTDVAERIRYSLSTAGATNGGLFRRESNQGGTTFTNQEIARNIRRFAFVYTLGSTAEPPEDNVISVRVSLTTRSERNDPYTGRPMERTIERDIVIRNFKEK